MKQLNRILFAAVLLCGLAYGRDPWSSQDLLQPSDLAAQLSSEKNPKPLVLFVGFPVLYRSAHIAGAVLAGPCSKPEGLSALKNAVRDVPRKGIVVIYCGCCPFVKCPNVRPAYTALHEMGFTNVKVVEMDTNFHTDWAVKGYSVERPADLSER